MPRGSVPGPLPRRTGGKGVRRRCISGWVRHDGVARQVCFARYMLERAVRVIGVRGSTPVAVVCLGMG